VFAKGQVDLSTALERQGDTLEKQWVALFNLLSEKKVIFFLPCFLVLAGKV